MSKNKDGGNSAPISMKTALIAGAIAMVAGFGAVYGILGPYGNDSSQPNLQTGKSGAGGSASLAAYAKGEMTAFVASNRARDLPEVSFQKEDGSTVTLADWRGRVVLLNLWATWCGPCRKEMPDLDKLKADLGGKEFDLVALSIDRTGLGKPRKFLDDIGIKHLALYNNSTGSLAPSLKAFGMPTTLLINREGKEIGRLVGPAHWGSEDAVNLIKAAIALKS